MICLVGALQRTHFCLASATDPEQDRSGKYILSYDFVDDKTQSVLKNSFLSRLAAVWEITCV